MISASASYLAELRKRARLPIYQVQLSELDLPTPIAGWRLDETSGTRADAIGSNNLTDNNTVTSATGKVSNAGQFNSASSEYLNKTIGGGNVLQMGDVDMTITAWVYMDSIAADHGFATQWIGGNAARSWKLEYSHTADVINFDVFDGTAAATVNDTNAAPHAINTWYFIRAWRDKTNATINIQVNNGAIHTLSTVRYPKVSTLDFTIGSHSDPSTYMSGRIDEVYIWKDVLTDAEAAKVYALGLAGRSVADFDPATYSFCTGYPVGKENLGEQILTPISLEQSADIENARFPLSTLTFQLADVNGVAATIVGAGIDSLKCDLYMGFWNLSWSGNYVQRFHGIVSEIRDNAGVFTVIARSPMAVATDKLIFAGAQTKLTSAATDTDTSLSVSDTSAFPALPSDLLWGNSSGTIHLAVDNEIIQPAVGGSTTFSTITRIGASLFAVPPLMPGSASAAHVANSIVKHLVSLGRLSATNSDSGTNDLHPIDLLGVVMASSSRFYGLNSDLVDANDTELAAARTTLGSGLKFRFLMGTGVSAKAFIEREFYLALGGYPRENNQGQLGIKLYQAAAAATAVDTIKDADIVGQTRWLRNAEKLLNTVRVNYDHDPIREKFVSAFSYQDPTLLASHARERALVIDAHGIRSSYTSGTTWFASTAAFLSDMTSRVIARFGNKAPIFAAKTLLSKQLLEVGDDVSLTVSTVMDIDNGDRGVSAKKCEIRSMRHDFRENTIDMELLAYP